MAHPCSWIATVHCTRIAIIHIHRAIYYYSIYTATYSTLVWWGEDQILIHLTITIIVYAITYLSRTFIYLAITIIVYIVSTYFRAGFHGFLYNHPLTINAGLNLGLTGSLGSACHYIWNIIIN